MSLDSIRREYVLNADLEDLDLPAGSLVIVELHTAAGTEISAYRVVGGNLVHPIVAKFRYTHRKTTKPTTVTLVSAKDGSAKAVVFPPDSAVLLIRLEPLLTETPDKVTLETISSSALSQILNPKE